MTPLRSYLIKHGRTQKWLAETLKVRQATVCVWVKGTAVPRPKYMQAIAEATDFEVPVTAWFPQSDRSAA